MEKGDSKLGVNLECSRLGPVPHFVNISVCVYFFVAPCWEYVSIKIKQRTSFSQNWWTLLPVIGIYVLKFFLKFKICYLKECDFIILNLKVPFPIKTKTLNITKKSIQFRFRHFRLANFLEIVNICTIFNSYNYLIGN